MGIRIPVILLILSNENKLGFRKIRSWLATVGVIEVSSTFPKMSNQKVLVKPTSTFSLPSNTQQTLPTENFLAFPSKHDHESASIFSM